MEEVGVYIHIPFCNSKCYYCDFISFPNREEEVSNYLDYLIDEMELYKDVMEEYKVGTIFIGGGTPSYIDSFHISRILSYIYDNFNADKLKEVTIECNPGTLNRKKLQAYKDMGINRLSLGLQSLNDEILKSLGRSHRSKDFYRNYRLIREVGFENINVDLMFGLPGQDLVDIESTMGKIVELGVEHISFYSLILEEGTPMNKWYEEGRVELPQEDLERDIYYRGKEILNDAGYDHYEISNFAKPGRKSLHNLLYWQLKPYLGFGLGAHSNIVDEEGNIRFGNYRDFTSYYESIDEGRCPRESEEYIGKDMEMAEYLIMGLRLVHGISRLDFYKRFNIGVEEVYGEALEKHSKSGLIDIDEDRLKFTPRGLDLSNQVLVDFLPE